MNKHPNIKGLIAHKKDQKINKANRLAKVKQMKIDKIREDSDKFVDTYLINLALSEENNVKIASVLTKWQDNKKKYTEPQKVELKPLDLSRLKMDVTLTD